MSRVAEGAQTAAVPTVKFIELERRKVAGGLLQGMHATNEKRLASLAVAIWNIGRTVLLTGDDFDLELASAILR